MMSRFDVLGERCSMKEYDVILSMKSSTNLQQYSVSLARVVRQLSHKLLDRSYRDRSAIDQFYRSGTSVGANIREARYAESAKDLVHKLKIAEKELAEFYYWLGLLTTEPMMITDIEAGELLNLANQIGKLLTASIITLKQKHKL